MMKKLRLNDNWLFVGVLSISVFLILTAFSKIIPSHFWFFFNSDTLHLPYMYKELFVNGNGLNGWNLPASPNFIPDMLLYFILMLILGDFIMASFVFSVLQYLVILGLFAYILKQILPENTKVFAAVAGLFIMLFLFDAIFSEDFHFTFLLLSNAYHNGPFVMTLLGLVFTFRYLQSGSRNSLIAVIVVSWLAIFSDRLFIIMFSLPFIVISLIYIYSGFRNKFRPLLGVNLIGLVLGLATTKIFVQTGYIYFAQPHKMLDLGNFTASLTILFDQLFTYFLQFNFKTAIVLFGLISVFFVCMFWVKIFYLSKDKRGNPITIYLLFTILFSGFVFFAPVINGNYSGWDTLRYNIGFFFLAMLNWGMIVFLLMEKGTVQSKSYKKLRVIVTTLAVIALSAGIYRYSIDGVHSFFTYYPKEVKAFDDVAEKYDLKMGVGHYWIAKHTTMFSKKGVVIHPVFDDITPYYHTTNENMYYADSTIYNFIVLNRFVDTISCRTNLGEGVLLDAGANLKIIKVDPFKFDKETKQAYSIGSR
jgi:hypothetical protein